MASQGDNELMSAFYDNNLSVLWLIISCEWKKIDFNSLRPWGFSYNVECGIFKFNSVTFVLSIPYEIASYEYHMNLLNQHWFR